VQRHRLIIRGLAMLAALGIVLGLLIGGAQPVAVGLFAAPWDKLAHASLFGGFAAILHLGLGLRPHWALLGATLLGAVDEIHQIWLPGRSAGLDDLAADVLGAALVLALVRGGRLLSHR
jgi:hypothetical protein